MMKNIKIIAFLCCCVWNFCIGQTEYIITKKLSTNKASSFWNKPEHGIKLLPSSTAGNFNIKVVVTTVDNIHFQYFNPCLFSPVFSHWHNDKLTMFATAANQSSEVNNKGYINDWQEDNPNYYYRSMMVVKRPCTSKNVSPDSKEFFKNQAMVTRWTLPPFNILEKKIDVSIKLILTGDIKLSDISEVKIPGVSTLYAQDFINQTDYIADHVCHNSNNGVCAELNKVRRIPNLTKTDVVIQAHRGVWGEPNTHQENTIGAMEVANQRGYKLLESDIMPIGVSNYTDPNNPSTFGVPSDLACFHDFVLNRYTSATSGYSFNQTRSQLSTLTLKKPRSETVGSEKIMFFDELVNYAEDNNLIVCVDMKNLESKGQGDSCTQLCDFQTQERKNISLYHNLKFAINNTPESKLKNIAIKTYAKYDDLKTALTTGANAVSVSKFNKVLWAPLIAGNPQWEGDDGTYDPNKIQKFLDDWFAHNESVLYYETNFFNDYDGKTSVMLESKFCSQDSDGDTYCRNIMQYIYNMTGRRAGIFSEEPVGGKGTVNRWGKWKIKKPVSDRRGDHLWLLKQPFFKHAVITTDRPDQWDQLND